jgi:hypothetical protein
MAITHYLKSSHTEIQSQATGPAWLSHKVGSAHVSHGFHNSPPKTIDPEPVRLNTVTRTTQGDTMLAG